MALKYTGDGGEKGRETQTNVGETPNTQKVNNVATGMSGIDKAKVANSVNFACLPQNEGDNPFFHLNLPYNENLTKHSENKEAILNHVFTILEKAIILKDGKMMTYSQSQGKMREIGKLEKKTMPDGTEKDIYILYKGETTKGKFICTSIKITGIANSLTPNKSSEGTDREKDNKNLAKARATNIVNIIGEAGFNTDLCVTDTKVFGKKDKIPGGISYESVPGVFISFKGKETTSKEEASYTVFGGWKIDWEKPFWGPQGIGGINSFYALYPEGKFTPSSEWESWVKEFGNFGEERNKEDLYKEFFAYVAYKASEAMFGLVADGVSLSNADESIHIERKGNNIYIDKLGAAKQVYVLHGGIQTGKDVSIIGTPTLNEENNLRIETVFNHNTWKSYPAATTEYQAKLARENYLLIKDILESPAPIDNQLAQK